MRIDPFFNFLLDEDIRRPTFKAYRAFFPKMMRQLRIDSEHNEANQFFVIEKYMFVEKECPLLVIGNINEAWLNAITNLRNEINWKDLRFPFKGLGWINGIDFSFNIDTRDINNNAPTIPQRNEKQKSLSQAIKSYLFQEGKILLPANVTFPIATNENIINSESGLFDEMGGNPEFGIVWNTRDSNGRFLKAKIYELGESNPFNKKQLLEQDPITISENKFMTVDLSLYFKTRPVLGKRYIWCRADNENTGIEITGFVHKKEFSCLNKDFPTVAINLLAALKRNFGNAQYPIYLTDPDSTYKKIFEHCLKATTDIKIMGIAVQRYLNVYLNTFINNVLPTVIARCQRDTTTLFANGLILQNDILEKIELSGSDFHKHGQQVLFLIFRSGNKIVYKPSSLKLDKLINGTPINTHQNFRSCAQILDPSGVLMPTYKIIPMLDNVTNQDYGYMEFIEVQGPENMADLHNIYKSIAANIALSFIIGLEDCHYDNILIRKNCIQLIDMEATSGVSILARDWVTSKLWYLGLTNASTKSVVNRLKKQITGVVGFRRLLTAEEITTNIEEITTNIEETFDQIIQRRGLLNQLLTDLEAITTRTVPIPTNWFSKKVFFIAQYNITQTDFINKVNRIDPGGGDFSSMVIDACDMNHDYAPAIKKFLLSDGTFNALLRMDIPYYSNNLGINLSTSVATTSKIKDEDNNEIYIMEEAIDGFTKLNNSISEAINERTAMNANDIKDSFRTNGVPLITILYRQLIT